MALRIVIFEDNDNLRESLVFLLKNTGDYEVAGDYDHCKDAANIARVYQPDVILMDLRMPMKDGIETTKVVAKQYPGIHIIALTMYEDERFVSHMMEIGANGYLLKSADPAEIKKAIMEVMSKGYYLNNFVNRILLKKSHSRQKTAPTLTSEITISDRERDVIKYICMEFTAQEIAQKLEVSPRTVEAIKDRLMERFGAKNTAGLVFFAVKNNLID